MANKNTTIKRASFFVKKIAYYQMTTLNLAHGNITTCTTIQHEEK